MDKQLAELGVSSLATVPGVAKKTLARLVGRANSECRRRLVRQIKSAALRVGVEYKYVGSRQIVVKTSNVRHAYPDFVVEAPNVLCGNNVFVLQNIDGQLYISTLDNLRLSQPGTRVKTLTTKRWPDPALFSLHSIMCTSTQWLLMCNDGLYWLDCLAATAVCLTPGVDTRLGHADGLVFKQVCVAYTKDYLWVVCLQHLAVLQQVKFAQPGEVCAYRLNGDRCVVLVVAFSVLTVYVVHRTSVTSQAVTLDDRSIAHLPPRSDGLVCIKPNVLGAHIYNGRDGERYLVTYCLVTNKLSVEPAFTSCKSY